MESVVAKIWQDILGIETIGIHDNFFDLGGHSLLGMQANTHLRRAFGIDLPIRTLFESPTVAALAQVCERLMIEQIDQLDEEEVERLLASSQKPG